MEQAVIQREMQNLDISAMQQLMAEQPLMAGQMQATGDAQLHHAAQPGLQPNQPFLSPTTSLQGLDDSMLDMDEADMELGSPRAVNNGKRKTGRSSNINQHEMQKIFEANKHRTLEDAAKPLRGDDQGAHTERNKQILAMLW